jgi:cysteinyl-tRNA synthetase
MQVYNTLTRQKEVFKPLRFPEVKMYQCGPTVYNNAHIWNLKTSVIEDLIARTLWFLWYQVRITMNITDVDDKTIRDSQKAGEKLQNFTQKYTKIFLEDIEKLGIELPENIKPVTELIPEMVRMIQTMLTKGFAYLAEDGSIYYSIEKFKKYGNLAHLNLSGMKSSVRIDNDEYEKEAVADFVLWKAWKTEDGENFWEEEFQIAGEKIIIKWRPWWHIECSACAMKYFGPQIDIHMGGEDLIFPHHQNEIAQTEACTGKTFSRYWLHSGHLMVDGKKMSKSLWNFYTLRDIEQKYPNEKRLYRGIRLSFLNGKYRDQIDFSFPKLEQNIKTIENIDTNCKKLARYEAEYSWFRRVFREQLQVFIQDFILALEDDFSFSEALAVFFEFQKYFLPDIQSGELTSDEQNACVDMYLSFNQVFAILDINTFEPEEEVPEDILKILEERNIAKSQKSFEQADRLRDELFKFGYKIIDSKDGSSVERV